MLAAAAIAGALLVSVPFLINTRKDDDSAVRSAGAGSTSGTVLGDSLNGDSPGSFGSAAPVPGAPNSSSPSKNSHDGKSTTASGSRHKPVSDTDTSHAGSGSSSSKGGSGSKSGSGTSTSKSGTSGSSGTKGGTSTSTGSGTGTGSADTTSSAPGVLIYSHAGGRCIDIVGNKGKDGSPLEIWDCGGDNWQKWEFKSDGTVRSMGRCMDVAWGSKTDGAVIQLAVCSGNPAQQFRLNSSHDLVNSQADKCVDVKDRQTGNGTRLQLWSCNGKDNQKWSTR